MKNCWRIKSVQEAYSMQPYTFSVYEGDNPQPDSIREIVLVSAADNPKEYVYRAINFNGSPLHDWRANAVNVTYYPDKL